MLPNDKRENRIISFVRSLVAPVQTARDYLIDYYANGELVADWTPSTYSIGVLVRYEKQLYESLVDGNTSTPSDIDNWVLVQSNFIGVIERANYSGHKLILEYALNKWFFTEFRQPPLVSDIYISNATALINPFVVGGVESDSSSVYSYGSTEYIIDGYSVTTQVNFTIYIPVAVYTALASDAPSREKIVRSFADKYVATGIFYDIQTY